MGSDYEYICPYCHSAEIVQNGEVWICLECDSDFKEPYQECIYEED